MAKQVDKNRSNAAKNRNPRPCRSCKESKLKCPVETDEHGRCQRCSKNDRGCVRDTDNASSKEFKFEDLTAQYSQTSDDASRAKNEHSEQTSAVEAHSPKVEVPSPSPSHNWSYSESVSSVEETISSAVSSTGYSSDIIHTPLRYTANANAQRDEITNILSAEACRNIHETLGFLRMFLNSSRKKERFDTCDNEELELELEKVRVDGKVVITTKEYNKYNGSVRRHPDILNSTKLEEFFSHCKELPFSASDIVACKKLIDAIEPMPKQEDDLPTDVPEIEAMNVDV